MKNLYCLYAKKASCLRGLPPLIFRLTLAYGFYGPATKKLADINAIATWFASMHYPFPMLNAYMATATENLGWFLLILGLGTRLISLPLMVVMVVAITTVHLPHGFQCGDNGFEVPFYYLIMLFSLVITGGGWLSLDRMIAKKCCPTDCCPTTGTAKC